MNNLRKNTVPLESFGSINYFFKNKIKSMKLIIIIQIDFDVLHEKLISV